MTTRMLIDARHSEETRVAVLKGNRIEEFDFESADRKQIKGNIYLAKVTRVEPSLQAAFVDFGGNRHGFLAFSEIHPDYYQIPKADRDALLAEEAAAAEEEAALRAAEDEEGDDYEEGDFANGNDNGAYADTDEDGNGVEEIDTSEKDDVATLDGGLDDDDNQDAADADGQDGETGNGDDHRRAGRRQGRGRSRKSDEVRAKRMELRRRYKIQDVIQRRQVLLVQVVKEERGNKGAALTTYLSLAGRYCVLMPNSGHGGGISRKISSAADRRRLKQIVSEMNLPKSMGCIVRTAGLQRTKTEIKRDFDYLARLWDEIRERTLASTAPAMIHSDSDLIKRAIRDIYNREIEEVIVEGEEGYRAAKEFMKLLMPSHARRVKQYADPVPLFQRYGAEDQLSAMYEPVVQLKSGGYLVINPTEALVSIDINSGRSTKEHGIEQTAVATNLEAAREIARQLRLRDMAGLVVIDFIDMEYSSNIRKVERAMKDALKNDRARIQVGRISGFGLMEMSRQRLRTGVLEATTRSCPHCDGTGLVRTASSAGLSALRVIEEEAAKGRGSLISLFASTEAAVYLLNAKRADLAEIERRYGVSVEVLPEGENEGAKMRIVSSGPRPTIVPQFEPIVDLEPEDDLEPEEDYEDEIREDEREERDERNAESDSATRKKRRRRRGGRNRKRDDQERDDGGEETDDGHAASSSLETQADEDAAEDPAATSDGHGATDGDAPRKKRRRRRPARDRARQQDDAEAISDDSEAVAAAVPEGSPSEGLSTNEAEPATQPEAPVEDSVTDKPKARTRRKKAVKSDETAPETADTPEETQAPPASDDGAEAAPKPKRTRRKKTDAAASAEGEAADAGSNAPSDAGPKAKPARRTRKKAAPAQAKASEPAEDHLTEVPAEALAETPAPDSPAASEDEPTPSGPPRRGWWQRTFGE